jgi:hypothetical protein
MPTQNPIQVTHANIDRALRAGRDLRIIVHENAARIADAFDDQRDLMTVQRALRDVWPGATVRRDVDCFGKVTWIALGPNGSAILARAEAPGELPALVRASIRVRPDYAISPVEARFPEVA